MEEKLSSRDEILYFHKVFSGYDRDRAWELGKKILDESRDMNALISSVQEFFALNTFESFALHEKFFSFKKKNLSFTKCFETLFDLSWSIAEASSASTAEA